MIIDDEDEVAEQVGGWVANSYGFDCGE